MGNTKDGNNGNKTPEDVAIIVARIGADTEYQTTQINAGTQKYSADQMVKKEKIEANSKIKAAQIANDPLTLDTNEAVAYELIKKTGILINPDNADIQKDIPKLAAALEKDGKNVKDKQGHISVELVVDAARGLVGENLDAIVKYDQVMDKLKSKNPSPAGADFQAANSIEKK